MENKKKKILITTSTFPAYRGDTCPRFVLDLSKALQLTGEEECLVLAPHSQNSKTDETIEGVKTVRYKYFYPHSLEAISGNGIMTLLKNNPLLFLIVPFFVLFQLISTFSLVKKYRPDVIIANWIVPQGFIAALIKGVSPKTRLIVVSHGGDAALVKNNPFIKNLAEFTAERADRLVAVSSFIKEILTEELKPGENRQIPVISMGVNEKLFKNTINNADRAKNILFTGRLVEKKGVRYLISAMKCVLEKHPDARLNVIGDGILKKELMQQTVELGLENSITFYGALEHSKLPEFFAKSLLITVPSVNLEGDFEGLPTVLPEAMAAKIPVIATDAGGIADLVKNYETGLIVEQKNSSQLAEKIIELIENSGLRDQLSQRAYQRILDDFTWERIGKKFKKLIKDF